MTQSEQKVSICSVVLNERDSIESLIQSLLIQSRMADEILFVDGGSADGTYEVLASYASRLKFFRVLQAPGSNVAEGRNAAFSNARYDLVASIDGGCVASKTWLAEMMRCLTDDVDIVSGVYSADPKSEWDFALQEFLYPNPEKLPDDWAEPSHRSVLIRRRAWESIGPIPTRLYRSEDTWFNQRAKQAGFRFRIARGAVVYWGPRKNVLDVFRNSYLWVKSDIENGVNATSERNRAIRITLRLLSKLVSVCLWSAALVVSPIAGILLTPVLIPSLFKLSFRMNNAKRFMLYNVLDYVLMIAAASGLIAGQVSVWLARPFAPSD